MLNPKVVIFNGNRVMAAWYTSSTLEITTMVGTIQNAPQVSENVLSFEPTQVVSTVIATQTVPAPTFEQQIPVESSTVNSFDNPREARQNNSGSVLLIASISVIGLILLALLTRKLLSKNREI